MHKTYGKNTLRTIRDTFGRFAAIFAIVALGVGFLAGLLSATPDMRESFDRYFDGASMYDIEIIGDLGLTDDDVAELEKLEGVESVHAGYVADALMTSESGSDFTVRLHSLHTNGGEIALNVPELTSGRLPQLPDECLAINVPLGSKTKFKIGDTIRVSPKNENTSDFLLPSEFKIVGFADYCPYFSAEKEYTNIGNGTVDLFLLVPAESFATDFYTDVYITVSGAKELTSLTGEYRSLVDETAGRIERLSGSRGKVRLDEFKKEAEEKLNNARTDYEKAKKEAETKLSDAEIKIKDGQRKIADGEKKLTEAKKVISENEKALKDSEAELNKKENLAKQAFAETEEKFSVVQREIDKNLNKIAENLFVSEKELENYNLSAGQRRAFDELRKLPLKYPALADNMSALQEKSHRLEEIGARLKEIGSMPYDKQGEYADEANSLTEEKNNLQSEINEIMSGEAYNAYTEAASHLAMSGAVSDELPALALKLGALDSAKLNILNSQSELDARRAEFESEKRRAISEIAGGRIKISEGREELESAKTTYYRERSKLSTAKANLAQSVKDYESAKAETEAKLEEGLKKITDAESEISKTDIPSWHIFTREDNISYSSLKANIDKVDAIARVFPFFFFLVAALVALTTMTRMIDEERLQIGTMKALGYSRLSIMRKYVLYALSASALGSAVGIAVGFRLFPTVIWNVYTMMYELPEFYCPINWTYAASTSGAVILCIILATINACRSTLREKPAQLMLPKAPEAGKRVLLEKITPLWSRMKFTHKVTARNLFRYKKRFFMTIIGVAGCTALLVTGFGLRDSFSEVADRQYGELCTYDILAPISGEGELTDPELRKMLGDKTVVSGSVAVCLENVTASYGKNSIDVLTFIPEKTPDIKGFVTFRSRTSGHTINFEEGSVIITEKASEVLKIKRGDTITITDKRGKSGRFRISGICENYVRNYIYMSEGTYFDGMGERAERNTLVIRFSPNTDSSAKTDFGSRLLETGVVNGVRYNSDAKEAVGRALDKINMIVAVIIISAGALAFVVLYNLTNINIEERVKEIATIKVLGFTDREVNGYVNRESVILSLIGTAIGLVFGVFLHRYVMGKAEMDVMMFGRSVKPISFVYSAVLTMIFSFFVNLIMGRKLRRISMVESMKAPE